MYYCSNCGSPVSGKGTCGHCGAYLKDIGEGSFNGMNAAQESYKNAIRRDKERELREKEKNNKIVQIYKYGYLPLIGIAPTIVMAAIGLIGLVLSYLFSLLYLIMFGLALILTFCLFCLHLMEDSLIMYGISYNSEGKNNGLLLTQAVWLSRYAKLVFFIGVFGSVGTGTQGPVTNGTIALICAAFGGLLLAIAVSVLIRKKFK